MNVGGGGVDELLTKHGQVKMGFGLWSETINIPERTVYFL